MCSISPTMAMMLLHHGRKSASVAARPILAPLSAAPAHDKAVEEEKDHRADDAADEASALSRVIPPDGLPEVGGNKCANDSQDGGEDKSLRLVVARHDKLGDNAGDEANDDRPDNTHIAPLPKMGRHKLP